MQEIAGRDMRLLSEDDTSAKGGQGQEVPPAPCSGWQLALSLDVAISDDTSCPICFETLDLRIEIAADAHFLQAAPAQREATVSSRRTPCCRQLLCTDCGDLLRRCPFCRELWCGPVTEKGSEHPWLRASHATWQLADAVSYNMASVAISHGPDLIHAIKWAACSWLPLVSSESGALEVVTSFAAQAKSIALSAPSHPVPMIAAACAGVVAVSGVAYGLNHQDFSGCTKRLQCSVREYTRLCIAKMRQCPSLRFDQVGVTKLLLDVLRVHLEPSKDGRWCSSCAGLGATSSKHDLQSRAKKFASEVCSHEADTHCGLDLGPREADNDVELAWAQLCFLFSLWLQYVPEIADVGSCECYGLPPMYLCRYSAWRNDLRHLASALACHWSTSTSMPKCRDSHERRAWQLARHFLVMLDLSLEALVDESICSTKISDSLLTKYKLLRNACTIFDEAIPEICDDACTEVDAMEPDFMHLQKRAMPPLFSGLWGQGEGIQVGRWMEQQRALT